MTEAERNLRAIMESSPDAIVIIDMAGRVVECSGASMSLMGIVERSDLAGLVGLDFVAPEDRERAGQDFLRALGSAGSHSGEYRIIRPDGTSFIAQASASLIRNAAGETTGLVVVARDVTKQRGAEERVMLYQKQLRALASELSLAEARERRRIATYLHDTICQALTTAVLKIEAIQQSPAAADIAGALGEVREIVSQTVRDARSATFDLSPPVLHELGLPVALEWLAERFAAEHGLPAQFSDEGPDVALTEDLRIVLFRAVRELLHNAAKHSHARRVAIKMKIEGSNLAINVEDDGRGFNVADAVPDARELTGFGLFAIRERLAHFGGKMEIISEPGRGTNVDLTVPIRPDSGLLREKMHER